MQPKTEEVLRSVVDAGREVVRAAESAAEREEALERMLLGYRQTVLGWGWAGSPYHGDSAEDRAWRAGHALALADLPRAQLPPEPEGVLSGWVFDEPHYLDKTQDGGCMAGPTSARWRCFASRKSDQHTVLGVSGPGPHGEPPTAEEATAKARELALAAPREADEIFLGKLEGLMRVARDRRIALALCRAFFAVPSSVVDDMVSDIGALLGGDLPSARAIVLRHLGAPPDPSGGLRDVIARLAESGPSDCPVLAAVREALAQPPEARAVPERRFDLEGPR